MKNEQDILDNIERQFLCNVFIKDFDWHNFLKNISLENQEKLLNITVNSELVLKHPIQTNYQKAFIKSVLATLELQGSVICDSWYEAYGRLVTLPSADSLFFKHYIVKNCKKVISLKENVNLISDGTTGLRTWQAALALSEWALHNKHQFNNKVLLELGSGIGLTGLAVALCCNPRAIYLTDCHSSVLNTLCKNIETNIENFEQLSTKSVVKQCIYDKTFNNCAVRVLNLPWEEVTSDFCQEIGKIDAIFAADVVYDQDLFESLVQAVHCLSKYCGVELVIFACTERNKDTLNNFLLSMRKSSFVVQELEVPQQDNFIWARETPVKIFSFKTT